MKSLLFFMCCFGVIFGARIFVYSPFPSVSHQIVFRKITEEYLKLGHEVYFATTDPTGEKIKNLTEIDISVTYSVIKEFDITHTSPNFMPALLVVFMLFHLSNIIMERSANAKGMQELFTKNYDFFDLLVVEAYHPAIFATQAKFKAPLIGITSSFIPNNLNQALGSLNHPAIYPDIFSGYDTANTFKERIASSLLDIFYYFGFKFYVYPKADLVARKIFNNDLYIEDYIKNASLIFASVNRLMTDRRPYPHNIMEVSQVHLPKVHKRLPKELQEILDNAKNGVVYFSLGTNVRLEHVDTGLKQVILDALSELPYTVLCKWNAEPLVSNNIIFNKWFPQYDLLAHPNVKVFVTQGGIQSADETIVNGVPVIVVPFLADQVKNARMYVTQGLGIHLDPTRLTKEILRDAIIEVIENKTYKINALKAQKISNDEPMSGLEKIVWWSEYVIRHGGADHLKSKSLYVPAYQYYLLDVLLFFVVLFVLLGYTFYKIISYLFLAKKKEKKE